MQQSKRAVCAIAIGFALACSVSAQTPGELLTYGNGFSVMWKVAPELHKTLAPYQREQLYPQPLWLDSGNRPVIRPIEVADTTGTLGQVLISAGFIDLLNRIAHARAIDKIERGYFENYLLSLAEEDGQAALKDLPGISDKRFWTEDMMNEQQTSFNQMAALIVAINLSHHYLGHYSKYADRLVDAAGQPVPINDLLTSAEWEQSVKAGTLNSLNCALATEGVRTLFEAFDKMPRRPAWTAWFLPRNANARKLNKELEKYQTQFFHGGLK